MTPAGGFLPDAARDQLARMAEAEMTASCSASRLGVPTPGPGGTQVRTEVPDDEVQGVPCKFRPAAAPNEVVVAGAVREGAPFVVRFPRGTPVRAYHRLTIEHDEEGVPNPLILDVVGVEYRVNEVTRRVMAVMVAGPQAPREA